MQVPIQITMREVEHSEAVEERIKSRAKKLDLFFDKITSCKVVIELHQGHRQTGQLYNVRINVLVPGKELIANRNEQDNLYKTIRDAFDDMERQVEDQARIMKGEVKTHTGVVSGEIVRLFDKDSFGFIEASSTGEEFYFNADNVVHPKFKYLRVGMPVHFVEKMGDDGPRACRVSAREKS
jgi:ribosomal subunit interface protein